MFPGQASGSILGQGQMTSQAVMASTRDLPAAAIAHNQLREIISRLDVEISGLIDRLEPAMIPASPQNDPREKDLPPGRSLLVQELGDQTGRLAILVRRVQEASSRLEI